MILAGTHPILTGAPGVRAPVPQPVTAIVMRPKMVKAKKTKIKRARVKRPHILVVNLPRGLLG